MRVLILGGTNEARTLAAALERRGGFQFVSSLAGRVSRPAVPPGQVRIGGFGGRDGLVRYLRETGTEALVDATHPFAETISRHAAEAAAETGCPMVLLRRPGWLPQAGDRWQRVPHIAAAAAAARASPAGWIFLTTGRRDLAAFTGDPAHSYLVRVVEQPDPAGLPTRHELILARGPYTVAGEAELLERYRIGLLVTKDSGGSMTEAKLVAARQAGIPVVMVDRPPAPAEVAVVADPAAAITWLDTVAG